MNFDTEEQKRIVLEALTEYTGRKDAPLSLGQAAALLPHVQAVAKGEVIPQPKPEVTEEK